MKKKVLFTASIAKHFIRFHLPYLKWFQDNGYEVHVACQGDEVVPFTDVKWEVPFERNPFSFGNVKAYSKLKSILNQQEYTLIHCHTPMASIVTRFAASDTRKRGTKVLYTAHGFHFYKGAPLINWLIYYPVEIISSSMADAIITINSEDYNRIKNKGSKKTEYYLIPGIGISKTKFNQDTYKNKIRASKGFNKSDFILVYAGEFIERKNHEFLIKVISKHINDFPNLKLLFCGRGVLKDKLELFVNKNNLNNIILFLGFRNDIDDIYKMADLGVSSSKQEGLGLNLVEEMMCGLPILATVDRGHKEIIEHGVNGFLFGQENENEFVKYLKYLYNSEKLRNKFGSESMRKAEKYEITNSLETMSSIYNNYL